MKTTTSLVAAAALLAACGTSELDPNAVRGALPTAEAVALRTPEADASAIVSAGVQRQALGDTPMYRSEYAVTSYWTAVSVNAGVGYTLGLLQLVTLFPPTECAEASCTWGPWVDDAGLNRWKLEVEKAGDAFEYALSAQNGETAGDFVTLLSGVAYPGPDRRHGRGSFTIDFDAEDALAHGPLWEKTDFGRVTVGYDNLDGTSIDAVLLNGKNDDPENPVFMNAVYAFEDRGAGGELQVAFENLSTAESVSLRTRWDAAGAGRSDAHYSGLDGVLGNGDDGYASECWAGEAFSFVEQYDSKFPELGPESACAFQPALYSDVSLPE
jgi:hypothetical protein